MIKDNKIIVIGNGSSVLNKKMGETIDSFEDVVRFNDYKMKGFQDFIGSRTTIWARSNSNRTKNRDWSNFNKVIVCSPEWNYKNIKRLLKAGNTEGILIPRYDALQLQNELGLPGRVRKKGKWLRGWPSTGLLLLDYLIKHYDCVYIYGFDFFKQINGHPRHYYNNKEKMKVTYVHDSEKEKKWVYKKIKEGKIKEL